MAGRGREPSHRERWVAAKLSSVLFWRSAHRCCQKANEVFSKERHVWIRFTSSENCASFFPNVFSCIQACFCSVSSSRHYADDKFLLTQDKLLTTSAPSNRNSRQSLVPSESSMPQLSFHLDPGVWSPALPAFRFECVWCLSSLSLVR